MDGRRLAAPFLAAFLLAPAFALPARADDPPPPDAPKPEEPKPEEPKPAEPKKPEKKKTDDQSIFTDWTLVKRGGIANAKARAEFWAAKGVTGKDLNWLGHMWYRGEEFAKAVEAWNQFLEWKPPQDDSKESVKLREQNATNRATVSKNLIDANTWKGDYAAAVKAAEKFREEFPSSSPESIATSWDEQGRAQRLAGDLDAALGSFAKAAENKLGQGVLDIIDIHLVEGRIDDAKAALTKFPMEDAKAPVMVKVKAWLEKYGNDAPSLEKAVNVGTGSPTIEWKGKPTIVYYWHMQLSNGVRRMQLLDNALREVSDKINEWGFATYNKLNPQSQKVEADMTEEAEAVWYRKLVSEEFPRNIPAAIVVPKSVLDDLGLVQEGQMVVVDAEGKIRYMRFNDMKRYDLIAVKLALQKLADASKPVTTEGPKPAGGGEPAK